MGPYFSGKLVPGGTNFRGVQIKRYSYNVQFSIILITTVSTACL